MASPRVFIQGGKRPEYVTSVHGMDSAEAAGEGSKKLNHQKMLDYFAKQVGCSATLESDANGSVYVFDGDCRTKIVSLLQSMEKLPFHSDPDSVVVNDYEFEVPEDEDVCQFEAASVFPYVLPPAGPFVEVHWLCADAPEDVGCKVPELECDEDGLINAWDDLTDAKDDIYADDVFALACEHNALTGKWVLRFAREDVNAAWDAVVEWTECDRVTFVCRRKFEGSVGCHRSISGQRPSLELAIGPRSLRTHSICRESMRKGIISPSLNTRTANIVGHSAGGRGWCKRSW